MDTLRLVTDVSCEVEAVLKVMNKLADDVGKSLNYYHKELQLDKVTFERIRESMALLT